jgi:hypothetical protein
MAQLFKLLADPDRMNTRLHRNASMRHIGEPRVDRLRRRPETTAVDHFTLLVESAVMAPYVAKVDADRQFDLATLPGYFRDEVLRWLSWEQSAPPSEDLLIPFIRSNPL